MNAARPRGILAFAPSIVLVIVAAIVVALVFAARPPRGLTIETGPVGGSYYLAAQKYQEILAQRGIDLRLRTNPNSLEIVRNVGDPKADVDVGFVAQDVSSSDAQSVLSIGQIEIQPLFIFASADIGRRSALDDLRGRRIVMPPSESATSDAAIRLFQLYDITTDNSQFTFMPLAEAAKALAAGKFDAGAFMLAAENPVIRELASNSGLRLMPITDVKAISNHLPFLRPATLPRGIYNIADAIPPINTPMIAAPVTLVVRKGLHPLLVFALLDAMTEVHRGPSLVSSAGEFPSGDASQIAVDPRAREYYRTGVPWLYRTFAPWPASVFERYQLWILGLLLIGGLYQGMKCLQMIGTVLWRQFSRPRG
jgi:TRAP transporter TAXI family solute receptor